MLRVKNSLGNKIKKYRKKLKITQKTLADMFKVNIEIIKTGTLQNKLQIKFNFCFLNPTFLLDSNSSLVK